MVIPRFVVLALASVLGLLAPSIAAQPPQGVVGSWAGPWSETGWRGWGRVSISSNGSCSGTIVRFTDGAVGTIRGSVDRDGNGSITAQYGGFETVATTVALKPAPGSLKGTYTYANGSGRAVRGSFAGKPWPRSWPDVSRYAGVWAGDWSGQGQRGSARFEVAPNGRVAATAVNLTLGFTSTLTGTLDPSGVFWADVSAPGQPRSTLVGQLTHRGVSVSGTFTQDLGERPFKGKFKLTRIDPAQFEGSWSGTWRAPGFKGAISLVAGSDGQVDGEVLNATTGQSGSINIVIRDAGSFSGVVTYPGQASIPIEGTFRWSGRNLAGSFTQRVHGQPLQTTFVLRRSA